MTDDNNAGNGTENFNITLPCNDFINYTWWFGVCDNTGCVNSSKYNFQMYDGVAPSCLTFSDISINQGSNYNFNVTCYDEHFYSLNITCSGDTSYSFFVDGLDVTSYNFNATINISETFITGTCAWEGCDGHTNNILASEWSIDNRTKSVIGFDTEYFNARLETSINNTFSYKKEIDKVSFSIIVPKDDDNEHSFTYKATESAKYLKSNEYPAWIVDITSKRFFDLKLKNMTDKDKYFVKSLGDGVFNITLTTDKKVLEFESTGELNCISGSFTITGIEIFDLYDLFFGVELSFNEIVFWIFLFIIGCSILVYAEYVKSVYMIYIAGMYIFAYSIFLIYLNLAFGFILLIVAMVIMLRGTEIYHTLKG